MFDTTTRHDNAPNITVAYRPAARCTTLPPHRACFRETHQSDLSRFVRFAESRFHLPRINQDASKLAEAMALIKTKRPDLEFFSPNDVIIEWNQRLGEGGFCTAYRAVWRGTSRLSNRLVPGCESSQRKTHTGVSKSRQAGSPFLL